ncbi:MAG: FAD:protein FMN transferase [Frankiaceae bacterium]|nr:FAD:protein FMN transferase [Frankiaceae bacterium]
MVTATRRDEHAQTAQRLGWSTSDWPALGTFAQLVVTDPVAVPAARAAVERVLADIDLAASRFRADSELSRLNASAGSWASVSPLLARALRVALDAAAWTDGVVDPTVGDALVRLGYDRTFADVAPVAGALRVVATPAPGWRGVELDDAGLRARVPAGTRLDLGATAKALASDLAAAAAAEATGCGVLVNLGGDIAVAGEPPPDGWPVAIEDVTDLSLPAADADPAHVVVIRDGGLATSSTRARRWRRGGVELHHLLDPRSGLPAAGPWRTVSVVASTCVLANTASTAAVILGDDAPGWLRERGFHARLIGTGGSCVYVNDWPQESTR